MEGLPRIQPRGSFYLFILSRNPFVIELIDKGKMHSFPLANFNNCKTSFEIFNCNKNYQVSFVEFLVHSSVQYCTVLYGNVQFCTVLYSFHDSL